MVSPNSHLKCAGMNNSFRPRSIFTFRTVPTDPGLEFGHFASARDLCHDFTNDVPFTISEILLNFARCSRRWFSTKLDVNGMKKATILVSYLTIVVNDGGVALPLRHRPTRMKLSEGSDPLMCDHHEADEVTQSWSAIAAVNQAILVL